MAKQIKLEVASKKLAIFESLMDIEPIRYLDKGEKVSLVTDKEYYGGKHKDKPYYKVRSNLFEIGYVLAEGLSEITNK